MRQAVWRRPLEMSAVREEGWYGGRAPPDAAAADASVAGQADEGSGECEMETTLSSWCWWECDACVGLLRPVPRRVLESSSTWLPVSGRGRGAGVSVCCAAQQRCHDVA